MSNTESSTTEPLGKATAGPGAGPWADELGALRLSKRRQRHGPEGPTTPPRDGRVGRAAAAWSAFGHLACDRKLLAARERGDPSPGRLGRPGTPDWTGGKKKELKIRGVILQMVLFVDLLYLFLEGLMDVSPCLLASHGWVQRPKVEKLWID